MCLLTTVAQQKGSGEFIRFTAAQRRGGGDGDGGDEEHGGGDGGSISGPYQPLGVNQGEVAMQGSGHNSAREFTEMVSALTHVVSSGSGGQSGTEWFSSPVMSGFGHVSSLSSFTSSSGPALASGSSSWVGHKRGREEQEMIVGGASSQSRHHLVQQAVPTRLFRNVGDFTVPPSQGESSSGAIALLYFTTS